MFKLETSLSNAFAVFLQFLDLNATRWQCVIVVLLGVAGLSSTAAQPPSLANAPSSIASEKMLRDVMPAVFTLLTMRDHTPDPTSQGTGFVVGPDGLAITAYHVISEFVGKKHLRLETKMSDGRKLEVRILAISVADDLALIKLVGSTKTIRPISMASKDRDAVAGSVVNIIGNPASTGMTIVRGQYSRREVKFGFDRALCACAISSGMSGGPALTASGNLLGVGVAFNRSATNVGYLIAADRVRALVDSGTSHPELNAEQIAQEIARQLDVVQAKFAYALTEGDWPQRSFGRYSAPDILPDLLKCQSSSDTKADDAENSKFRAKSVSTISRSCKPNQNIFSVEGLAVNLTYAVRHVRRETANPIQFQRQIDDMGLPTLPTKQNEFEGTPTCLDRSTVAGVKGQIPVRVVICSLQYKAFSASQEVLIRVITRDRADEALLVSLSLEGIRADHVAAITNRLLEHIHEAL